VTSVPNRGGTQALGALVHALRSIHSELPLNQVLEVLLDMAIEISAAGRGFIMLENGGDFDIAAARNYERDNIDESQAQLSRSLVRQVADTGQGVLTNNAAYDSRFAPAESVQFFDLRSIVCVPLKVGRRTEGVIYLDNQLMDGAFSEEDQEFLTALSEQAAPLLLRGDYDPSPRKRQVSVLFADVHGLETVMQHADGALVMNLLTRFAEEFEEAVTARKGTLSTRMGTGIFAVFGAPEPGDDHAEKALAAGRALLQKLEHLHPDLKVGVGVHSGRALVGEAGGKRTRSYTVLGDTPTLALNVERLTQELQAPLLFTEATWWLVGRDGAAAGERSLDSAEPVKLYRL